MLPYFIILFLLFLLALLDSNSKNNVVKIFVFIVLTLFAGLRYNVGIDYPSYIEIFNASSGEFSREPGRQLLIDSIKLINGSGQLYIFIMALITELFAYKTLIKYEKKDFWFLTIVFYCISLFYIASFNASREYMAIAIMLWGLQYVKKSFWKYATIALIAGLGFHFSALLFIPLYFFIKYPHSKITILLLLVCIIFSSQFLIELLYLTPYAKYIAFMENDTRENQVQITQYLLFIVSLMLVLFGDKFKNFKDNVALYNMNVLCMFTLALVIVQEIPSFIMLFQRFNNYFVYSYLLIIPSILSSMHPKTAHISKIFIVLFSIGYLILTVVVKGEHHMIVPYDMNYQLFNF